MREPAELSSGNRPARVRSARTSLVLIASLAVAGAGGATQEQLLRIRHAPKPEYPARAMAEGLGMGEVRVLLEVDEFGQVDDTLVVAHTHEVFVHALLEQVEDWRFEPARIEGKPRRTILQVDYAFRVGTEGMVFVDRKGPAHNLARAGQGAGNRWAFEPCGAGELDRPLRALERPAPAYPKALKEGGTGGRVLVEFYVDGNGQTRFAQVVGPVHPILDAAVIAAVKEWRFEPPRQRGRAALVRVTQAFEFVSDGAAAIASRRTKDP